MDIPDGWKLVPVEPTAQMIAQGQWKQVTGSAPVIDCVNANRKAEEIYKAMLEAVPKPPAVEPIPMILYCPACGMQHIDTPESDESYTGRLFESSWWELGGDKPKQWTNPPHRSHECQSCKHIWRPADVTTTGVKSIQTSGRKDNSSAPLAQVDTFSSWFDAEGWKTGMTTEEALQVWNSIQIAKSPAQEVEPVAWVEVTNRCEGPYRFHAVSLMGVGRHNLYTSPPSPKPSWSESGKPMNLEASAMDAEEVLRSYRYSCKFETQRECDVLENLRKFLGES